MSGPSVCWFIMSVGGGFMGIALAAMAATKVLKLPEYGLAAVMAATFGFGVFGGLRLMESEEEGLRLLRWFFAAQIPIVSSPLFAYHLFCGLGMTFSVIGNKVGFLFKFGSEMVVSINQGFPWGLGLNAFALFMFAWNGRLLEQAKGPDNTAEPDKEEQHSMGQGDVPP